MDNLSLERLALHEAGHCICHLIALKKIPYNVGIYPDLNWGCCFSGHPEAGSLQERLVVCAGGYAAESVMICGVLNTKMPNELCCLRPDDFWQMAELLAPLGIDDKDMSKTLSAMSKAFTDAQEIIFNHRRLLDDIIFLLRSKRLITNFGLLSLVENWQKSGFVDQHLKPLMLTPAQYDDAARGYSRILLSHYPARQIALMSGY